MNPIRVMITDDHLIVREGLRLILETTPDIEVVGEATDGIECLERIVYLLPHVVLMDLRMPRMDGISTIEQLRQQYPQVAIVILTTYNEDDLMMRGLRAGACGYLLKDSSREDLHDAIHTAAKGSTFLKPDTLARMLALQADPKPHAPMRRDFAVTEREHEVLQRAAKGERNKEIAYALNITERTVKAHLASIYQKFGVDSRAAAVAIAAEHKLLDM